MVGTRPTAEKASDRLANLGDRPDDLHGTGSAAVASARAR